MNNCTIFQVDEHCLRLNTQKDVPGMIGATRQNATLVALYLRLDDQEQNRIHEMMNQNLECSVEREFIRAVRCLAEEQTCYIPARARVRR